jgi:REP element-mobilizing transposase RayT
MPQSYCKICTHLVFSTKYREARIDKFIEVHLFKYLSGICKNLDCPPINVGGYVDHVHLLFLLNKKMTLIKIVEEIKKSSSKWIKTNGELYRDFYWQDGYGAFSVSPQNIKMVSNYISNQEQHHKTNAYKKEFIELLDNSGIDYDNRFIWD